MEKMMGNQKSKDTLGYCNNNFCWEEKEGNNVSGFSWPPRHYACTFCSRKFKSAQALGGHMNVHRRDRAMLRQPPSWVNLDSQNPNPNTSSSTFSATHPPYSRSFYSFSSSTSATSHGEMQHMTLKTQRASPASPRRAECAKKSCMRSSPRDDEKLKGRRNRDDDDDDDELKVVRNGIVIRLDLEIGLLRDTSKEELDLELRLGSS